MARNPLRLVVLGAMVGCAGHGFATGYFGPTEYIAGGGKNLVATPEFYWDLEAKRLAGDFHPTEKPVVVRRSLNDDGVVDQGPLAKATTDADANDFADALKAGEIKPTDVALATQQHTDARSVIDGNPPGTLFAEFDSEFADYHRGADAYRLGPTHYDDAKKAWQALLNRPAAERHYRSVWAAFMLGKLAMKAGDPDAAKWFEQTRDLARQGFADSLGMAADSYGWEGRSEWKQNHPEKAAPLFLTQLALGDESAVVSLKALIPDRVSIYGMLNYGPDPQEDTQGDNSVGLPADATTLAALKAAAADPLLQRLVTAHILATGWGGWYPGNAPTKTNARSQRWLQIINEVKPATVQDAEYLGWLAYMGGDYKEAKRWLDLSKSTSPAASWLRAKLQLRDGNLEGALKSLAGAVDTLRSPALYTGWTAGPYANPSQSGPTYIMSADDDGWTMAQAVSGDFGLMHLDHANFVQAMDILLKGGLWEDASFIAERVLTANELKAYVDPLPVPPSSAAPEPEPPFSNDTGPNAPESYSTQLRNLLGRRLVREDRYAEAAKYLAAPYDKIVQKYSAALKDGANTSLPKEKRAQALFTAAWLARFDGMELMGTEVAPDGFDFGGGFEDTDLAQERLSSEHVQQGYADGSDAPLDKNVDHASKREIQRLKKNTIDPDKRYHYRYVAAALAMRAATLLPDNTEELADVVNTAGNWIKNQDEKLGDRYFQVIDRRCAKTTIGAQASAAHWFIDSAPGPWSTAQQTAYDAMHKAYGDTKTEEQ
jgi:hypothetical protein